MNNNFIEHFEELTDPRVERTKKYPLIEVILLVVTAMLSGCEGWKQIKDFGDVKLAWLRKFLPYDEGIPVDDTIARIIRKLDTKEFQKCFVNWIQFVCSATNSKIVAIDGKTLRRSHDKKTGASAIHMVSAWCSENGVVLGQEKTSEKSNEITAIPELLEVLELKNCIVTLDAMGCQTNIAKKIVDKEADYVLALKGNQGNMHNEVKDFFGDCFDSNFKNVDFDYYDTIEKAHGRIELRKCWAIKANIKHIPSMIKWANLSTIIAIESTRTIDDHSTTEVRYYISSCRANAEKLLNAVRKHWGVENQLHWVLDVSFREDDSRIRTESSPENLAVMRHIVLNILKKDSSKKASVKRKRILAALDDTYREQLVRNIS